MKRFLTAALVMLLAGAVAQCFGAASTSTAQSKEFGSGIIWSSAGDSEQVDSVDTNDYFIWLSDVNSYYNPAFRMHVNKGGPVRTVRVHIYSGANAASLESIGTFDTTWTRKCTVGLGRDTVLPIDNKVSRLVKLRFVGAGVNNSATYIKYWLQVKKEGVK